MSTTLFCMPIKKGKLEAFKAFVKVCLGERKSDYKDLLKRYGLNIVKIWTHTLDGKDYALFIHEMSHDAAESLKNWSSSTHPFDQWFDKHLRECYDIEDFDTMPPQPEFFGEIDANDLANI